jgi:hypothetical protein
MTFSPLAAGIVETFSRNSWTAGPNSNVTIMTQIPQYTFIGLADVFALIPSKYMATIASLMGIFGFEPMT